MARQSGLCSPLPSFVFVLFCTVIFVTSILVAFDTKTIRKLAHTNLKQGSGIFYFEDHKLSLQDRENGPTWSIKFGANPFHKITPSEYPRMPSEAKALIIGSSPSNRSVPNQPLLYNRVPKCGSTTMQRLIALLSQKNNFVYLSSNVYTKHLLSVNDEQSWVQTIVQENQTLKKPLAIDRHFYFVDLERYGTELANWINIVRDPIDRLISEFYFHRQMKQSKKRFPNLPQTWFNLTFNECLKNNMPECMFYKNGPYLRGLQLTYFCGSALECLQIGNVRALQQAKYNLERYYSVVGIMSDLKTSLRVMEAYLPAFFTGAQQVFQGMSSDGEEFKANRGTKKLSTTLDSTLYESLKSNLSTEYQFYEFAVKRLIDQDRHIRTVN